MRLAIAVSQGLVILALGVLGGVVWIKRSKNQAARLVALLCFLTCGWIAGEMATDAFAMAGNLGAALLLRNVQKLFTTNIGATLVGFAWYFPRKFHSIGAKHLRFTYLIGAVFAIGAFTPWDVKSAEIVGGDLSVRYGWLHYLYAGYFAACGLYALGHLFYEYREFSSPILRAQIQYVAIGLGLSFLGATVPSLVLPLLGERRYFFVGTLAPAVGFGFMAYAISKHHVMEIEAVVHRALLWLLTSSLVLLPVALIILLAGEWIRGLSNWGLTLFATVMFFPFFAYTRQIQPLIDRLFWPDNHATRAVIDQFTLDIQKLKHLADLAHMLLHTVQRVFEAQATLLVYCEASDEYLLFEPHTASETRLTDTEPFLFWLSTYDAIIGREQIEFQPEHDDVRDIAHSYFQKMNAEVCVPFVHEGRLFGVLTIGRRAGKRWYLTTQEVELLNRLRAAFALALENSLLHETQLDLQKKQVQAELIAAASGALAHAIINRVGLLDAELNLLRDILAGRENENPDVTLSNLEAEIRRIERIGKKIQSAKTISPRLTPCELDLIVREALWEVKRANPHASIHVNGSIDAVPEFQADAEQLQMAFENLIANAYEAMQQSSGELTIRAATKTPQNRAVAQIEIQDTGCGMSAELVEQITSRPFITQKKRTGMGLGVWTARKIIESHGGTLHFRSQEGVGTTAIVVLPLSIDR